MKRRGIWSMRLFSEEEKRGERREEVKRGYLDLAKGTPCCSFRSWTSALLSCLRNVGEQVNCFIQVSNPVVPLLWCNNLRGPWEGSLGIIFQTEVEMTKQLHLDEIKPNVRTPVLHSSCGKMLT